MNQKLTRNPKAEIRSPKPEVWRRGEGSPNAAAHQRTVSDSAFGFREFGFRISSFIAPALVASLFALAAHAQTIPNPSFEADSFTVWPGYVFQNAPIAGWSSGAFRTGLNPADGSPFADNGAVPQGVNVAFIQSDFNEFVGLTNTITGLTIGQNYVVTFRANKRSGYADPSPACSLNGGPFVPFTASPAVGGANPYHTNSAFFTATATTAELILANQTASDSAVLVDDFSIFAVPGVLSVVTGPATGVSNSVAVLHGSVNPGGLPASAWFEWAAFIGSATHTTAPVTAGGDLSPVAFNQPVASLAPGTTYYCRAVASNAFGVVRGATVLFGSPALVLPGAVVMTNECHAGFADPGATATASPLAIASGTYHTLALKSDGKVLAWGGNLYGETTVPAGLSNVVAIAVGNGHSLALRGDGTVNAWGRGSEGQTTVPPGLSNVVAIAAGGYHNLALKSDGGIVAWGEHSLGQTSIPAGLSNVVVLSAGTYHSLALKSDGTVTAWGANFDGQVNVPVGLSNVMSIASGNDHVLALKNDGTVTAWGANFSGQVNVPAGLSNVVAIAGGFAHSLALKSDGTVVGWGNNHYGELNAPVGLSNVVAIAVGFAHSLALKSDGTIVAWGQRTIPSDYANYPVTVSGSVDTNTPGSYLLTYTAANLLGGVTTATRTVWVTDTIPPAVTLLGTNLVFITNAAHLPFIDPGALAQDACAGTLSVTVTNLVNTNAPGIYPITYTATDAAGNRASAVRQVVVTLAPAPTNAPAGLPGDANGDGVIGQLELDAVYGHYLTNSPWLQMTNVLGLGTSNVNFALPNPATGGYTVEFTTDLVNWQPLGPAAPRYQFTDTNAPAGPMRYYRLRHP